MRRLIRLRCIAARGLLRPMDVMVMTDVLLLSWPAVIPQCSPSWHLRMLKFGLLSRGVQLLIAMRCRFGRGVFRWCVMG